MVEDYAGNEQAQFSQGDFSLRLEWTVDAERAGVSGRKLMREEMLLVKNKVGGAVTGIGNRMLGSGSSSAVLDSGYRAPFILLEKYRDRAT